MPDAYRVVDRIQDQSDFDQSWNSATSNGYVMVWNSGSSLWVPSVAYIAPGGSSGQLQYNNAGAFGGLASTAVTTSGSLITVTAPAATDVPLTLTGHASQTANLVTLKKGASTVSVFSADGALGIGGSPANGALLDVVATQPYARVRATGTGYVYLGLESSGCAASILTYGAGNFIGIAPTGTSGFVPFKVSTSGQVAIGTSSMSVIPLIVTANITAVGQKIVLASGTPTADAFQVTLSDGTTVLTNVTTDGYIYSRNSTNTQYVGLLSSTGTYPGISATHNAITAAISFNGTNNRWESPDRELRFTSYGGIYGNAGNQFALFSTMTHRPAITVNNTQGGPTTTTGFRFGGLDSYIDVSLHADYACDLTLCSGGTSGTGQISGDLYLLSGGNFSSHAGNSQPGQIYIGSGPESGTGIAGDVHLGYDGSTRKGKTKIYVPVSPSVTPTALTASVNDYAPTAGELQLWSTDGGNYNVTGLDLDQVDGQKVTIINSGSSGIITLADEDAASTAANRFDCVTGASIELDPGERADLVYIGAESRWRAF